MPSPPKPACSCPRYSSRDSANCASAVAVAVVPVPAVVLAVAAVSAAVAVETVAAVAAVQAAVVATEPVAVAAAVTNCLNDLLTSSPGLETNGNNFHSPTMRRSNLWTSTIRCHHCRSWKHSRFNAYNRTCTNGSSVIRTLNYSNCDLVLAGFISYYGAKLRCNFFIRHQNERKLNKLLSCFVPVRTPENSLMMRRSFLVVEHTSKVFFIIIFRGVPHLGRARRAAGS